MTLPLNSLANEFDIVFTGDYLYNTVENEGNFRNILINRSEMGEHDLTAELEQLAFYGAHSLTVGNGGRVLLSGDDNTTSSSTDRPGGLALAVMSQDEHVLALGDVDFLSAPYSMSLDNSQFVARIADFLVASESRRFVIQDFPFFYQPNVELVYVGSPDLGPDAFDEIIQLQDAFQNANMRLTLAAAAANDHDTLYLGLYNQASDLEAILSEAGITLTIDPAILTVDESDAEPTPAANTDDEETDDNEDTIRQVQSTLGNIQMSGTALLLLDESDGQRRVIILAASKVGLENTVDRLLDLMPLNADYALADCLVQDYLALCPSGVVDEEVEAELDTGGAPEPIVIDDNSDNGNSGDVDELGAVRQGTVSLGDTVEGELGQNESHSWVFNDGPALIDIISVGPDLDGVLELYDSDYELIESMDDSFTGETEELIAIEIPDDSNYYIVVRDYFGDPSEYTLEVVESAGGSDGGELDEASIFIFVDDDGTPSAGGISSGAVMADLLSSQYDVTLWTTSIDGPLDEETVIAHNLIVWDSGDYRTEDAAIDEDSLIILNRLVEGGAALIIFGTTPPLLDFAPTDLVTLADMEAVGTEAVLMDGIEEGSVYVLDQPYDVIDVIADDFDAESDLVLFEGGPDSADVGYVGAASQDELPIFFMLAPYVALPTDLQEILLTNIVAWMGF
ncbi:MAG: hypothetical protein IPL78_22980 [Chloroflexi bacterium]|nr:hypothetical protein [Chloroflexota bacterium]